MFTSPSWIAPPSPERSIENPSLRPLSVLALAVILVQLVLGATLRHSATWDQNLPLALVLAHVGGAFVVTLVLGATVARVFARHRGDKYLTRPALFAATLLLVQLSLGIAAYIVRARSPFDPQPLTPMVAVTVAHVACGALVFASTIVLTLRIFRVVSAEQKDYALATA